MAERSATGEHFVQCGFTALRDPATGGFLPSVPLYIKVGVDEIDRKTGVAECEKELCVDIATVFAEKFGEYVRGTRKEARRLAKRVYKKRPCAPIPTKSGCTKPQNRRSGLSRKL